MVSIRFLFLAFFLIIANPVIAQNNSPKIDSLFRIIKNSYTSLEKAKAYDYLGWNYLNTNLDLAKKYIDSSYILYKSFNNSEGLAKSNYAYGVWHSKSGNYDVAIRHINDYQNYAEKIADSFNIANCLYQKGVVYSNQGDYEKALIEYYHSLSIFENLNNQKSVGFILNSIGIIQKNLKNYPKAIESYKKAIETHKALENLNDLSNAYANLANVYSLKGDENLALEYYSKSLKLDKDTKNNWGIAINYMDIAGILLKKKQCKQALSKLNEAYKIQTTNNFKKEQIETLTKLGLAHLCLKDFKQSELFFNQALEKKSSSKSVNRDIHYGLYELYKETLKNEKALFHFQKYNSFKDSIFEEENFKNINKLQIQYESKKKDLEIEAQKIQLQQKEIDMLNKEKELRIALFSMILFLAIAMGLWLYLMQRKKLRTKEIEAFKIQQEVQKLESLIEGEEKERKRIAQDLHDGINGDLSVIKYKVTSVNKNKFSKNDLLEFNTAITMLDNAIEQVRHISHNLAPPSLQNFNLIEAIKQYCLKMSESKITNIDFNYYGEHLLLNNDAETSIYRIIQELINNIIKHANATEALVQLNNHNDALNLVVEDNGMGFDINKANNGLGMKNIQSRVTFLKGELDIESNNSGTTVIIDINLKDLK